jgi:single-stranded-DNA-specific exonuclease
VLAHADWSHGVVGIVASKLVEKWQKPVLVAQVMGDHTKGSARSTGAFNMVEALRANSELFTKYGGHFFAAGYTLPTERLEELRAGLNEYYRSSKASEHVAPVRVADIVASDLGQMDWPLLADLETLEPFGSGNPKPMIELSGVTVQSVQKIGADAKHLKLVLRDSEGRRIGAIGFGLSARHGGLREGQTLTATGELNKNEFNGASSLQLVIDDLRYE